MLSRVCAAATAAFFSLPLPKRRARRRNRAPGRVAVRAVARAASAMAARRCWSPLRVGAFLCLPADSLSPGVSPARAASRAAVANRAMSPPVSATMTSAVRRPAPGDGDQPGDDGLERGGGGSDQLVQLGDLGGEVVVGVQVQTAHLRVRG